MMTLYIDTETTGFRSPRLLEVAARLDDEHGHQINVMDCLVLPDGEWSIEPEAEKVHGITREKVERDGIPVKRIICALGGMFAAADQVVAYNAKHEQRVLAREASDTPFAKIYSTTPWACALDAARLSFNGSHTLDNAVRRLLGEEPKHTHRAAVDMEYCRRVWRHLRGSENKG